MSKAEHMGALLSRSQIGDYSCHLQSPSGNTRDFEAECANSDSSQNKHHLNTKIFVNEPGETITVESIHPNDGKLPPIAEHVSGKHSKKPHEDASKSIQSCRLSEQLKLGSVPVENKLVDIYTDPASLTSEQFREPAELEKKSSPIENISHSTKDSIYLHSFEQLGPASEDRIGNSSLHELGTPAEKVAENSSSTGPGDRRTSKSLMEKYALKSVASSHRVLRSRSREKPKPQEPSQLANDGSGKEENGEKRKKRKKKIMERRAADEFSKIEAQVRYFLNRINYEQSLIAAYSGEGWKGLSLDKLKPEKELQRATSEILRRKLKIRDLFQRLDSLCAEGRLPESLFDSDGEIDSEDIFCAKCGSKDLSLENDIILCDGVCDRGFHQLCLEPPLRREDIPPGDESWLCPACDCKVDCLDLLNEALGTHLSVSDKWEKVFPVAAAGDTQDPNFGLPSDDSDNNNYDPEGLESDDEDQGVESRSTRASDEMSVPPNDKQFLGLPSDDSEDDDYDPDDANRSMAQECSSSDFTSDSEDLGDALNDDVSSGEVEGRLPTSHLEGTLEPNPYEDESAAVSGKRSIKKLDYKKLYDEEYGDASYHSSEDDDWTETVTPRKRQKNSAEVAVVSLNGNYLVNNNGKNAKENTPESRTLRKTNLEDKSSAKSHESSHKLGTDGNRSIYKKLGEHATQQLYQSFKENQYPDHSTKEKLAKSLYLTYRQVNKWFENARWSFRQSNKMNAESGKSNAKKTDSPQIHEKPIEQGMEMETPHQSSSICNRAKDENTPEGDINGNDGDLANQATYTPVFLKQEKE